MSYPLLTFKSLAQRFRFTGQQSLVKARSPLSYFRPSLSQSQSAPFAWATPSFSLRETSNWLREPLGHHAIASPDRFISDKTSPLSHSSVALERSPVFNHGTDTNNTETTQPINLVTKASTSEPSPPSLAPFSHPGEEGSRIGSPSPGLGEEFRVRVNGNQLNDQFNSLPEIQTEPGQSVQAKREVIESDRSPTRSTTSSIRQSLDLTSDSEPKIQPPLHTTSVPTHPASEQTALPISDPQIALKSEEGRSLETGINSSNVEQNAHPTQAELVQRQPEEEATEISQVAPKPSETTAVQPNLDHSPDGAIASPAHVSEQSSVTSSPTQIPATIQRTFAGEAQQDDAKSEPTVDERSPSEPTALTSAPSTVQLRTDAEGVHRTQDAHLPEESNITSDPNQVSDPVVQTRPDSQTKAFQSTHTDQESKATTQHSEQSLAIAPQPSEPVQLKSANTSVSNSLLDTTHDKSSNRSISENVVSQSIVNYQNEDENTNTISRSNEDENTNTISRSVVNRLIAPSQTDSTDGNVKASPSLQRKLDQTYPAIAPPLHQTSAQRSSEQWSDVSELLEIGQSNNPYSDSIDLADFSELSEINEDGAIASPTALNSIEPSGTRADPRSVSLHSPVASDRPNAPTLEQQLETLVYPVYSLLTQQWQIEQERQFHFNSSSPNWISDTRLSKLERSTQTAHHNHSLEPPNPNSPLHRKLELLAQQVYHLVQWQWAIDRERNEGLSLQ